MSDPYADYVVFDAPLDSLPFTDRTGKPINIQGTVALDTTDPAVGAGCADLGRSAGNKLWSPNHADFSFGTEDFCVEIWTQIKVFTAWNILIGADLSNQGWAIQFTSAGMVSGFVQGFTSPPAGTNVTSANGVIKTNQWYHIAMSRYGRTLTLFVDGIPVSKLANSTNISTTSMLCIGNNYANNTSSYVLGLVDGARITKGAARYTGPFDPMTGNPLNISARLSGQTLRPTFKDPDPWMTNARLHQSATRTGNSECYGNGFVAGTVKVKGSPNKAVHRETWLLDRRTAQLVGVTWSDPVTGAFRFDHVDERRTYTVLAYDYALNFRAVVADNIRPEPMK